MNRRNVLNSNPQDLLGLWVVLVLSSMLFACAATEKKAGFIIPGNKDGHPVNLEEKQLQPGLDTIYLFNKYRHVDHMHVSEGGIAKFGRPGEPILQLNHRFGEGDVFASGRSTEVGVLLKGYFHLEKPGTYLFKAKSNDGFQLYIDGQLVVSDPVIHSDRLSEIGKFEAVQAGMFPVAMKYFQRKGTASLELYWQPPGADDFTIVPREVYRH